MFPINNSLKFYCFCFSQIKDFQGQQVQFLANLSNMKNHTAAVFALPRQWSLLKNGKYADYIFFKEGYFKSSLQTFNLQMCLLADFNYLSVIFVSNCGWAHSVGKTEI